MSTYQVDAPADKRLMAEFLAALEGGDTRAKLDTPAFSKKRHTLGEIIADEAGGNRSELVLGCLLRTFGRALKSRNMDERLQAQADAAVLARLFSDTHAEAGSIADAEAEDEFKGDYSDALRLRDKEARAEVTF